VADSAATPLVGRSRELDRVPAAIERAAAGAGSTVLLAGEEGIGKTRLAAEALLLARQRGFLTLTGTAYALHTRCRRQPNNARICSAVTGPPTVRPSIPSKPEPIHAPGVSRRSV
jgi:predicted ATPase